MLNTLQANGGFAAHITSRDRICSAAARQEIVMLLERLTMSVSKMLSRRASKDGGEAPFFSFLEISIDYDTSHTACQAVFRERLISFSISTPMNTIEERTKTAMSSVASRGRVRKTGFKTGT
jgi:hypothetical protein